jgi:hypothetical protein
MLTVQKLIDQLQQVKDKSAEVVFDEGGAYYELTEIEDQSGTACFVAVSGKKICG